MDEAESVVLKYRRKGALIDSNLLLLLFVGSYKRELIGTFKRVNTFVPEDYDVILRLVGYFSPVVTTPNILTEVSNLAGYLPEPDRASCFSTFVNRLTLLTEHYVKSGDAVSSTIFQRLGLTDAAIEKLAKGKYLVITDDFELSQRLASLGVDTLNFNHIRYLGWPIG